MSKYINIGNTDFASVRKDEYVDKSPLIAYVNSVLGTQRKFLCVTRARRFGKSLAAKMLCAYYDNSCDSRSLFDDLLIAQLPSYREHLNRYIVIYLDVSSFTTDLHSKGSQIVYEMNNALSKELRADYPNLNINPYDTLPAQLLSVVEQTHKQFFFIIDEWDAICREMDDEAVIRQYVDWLRNMFKTSFADRIFAGVYMTGILPIKQYNTESALNNFEEFSMVSPGPLAGYFGFITDEVITLCRKYDMDEPLIKQWYDGYQLADTQEIYNPFSVMRAVQRHSIESYWTATTTYENLKKYILMNFEGLKDAVVELLAGNEVRVDVGRFVNDIHEINSRDAVLTLLIHLGYLSYNKQTETVRIPNYEVQREFERTIKAAGWDIIANAIAQSERLLADTIAGNDNAVAKAIDAVHTDNTSILQYNDENSLACVLTLAYYAAKKDYLIARELPTGKGFADIVLLPKHNINTPAIVLELKYNKSVEGAIEQIKEKRYVDNLKDFVGDILLVGINYDKKSKKHTCIIERISDKISDKFPISTLDISDKISDKLQRIVSYMQNHNGVITQIEVAQMFEVSDRQARNYLKELIDAKIITPQGANKNRIYKLNPTI